MIKHLFYNFLHDDKVYAQAERYWAELWSQNNQTDLDEFGWKQPWFQPLPLALGEGNPIFSAVSLILRRGVRILQSEPTDDEAEFFAYPDVFGGTISDSTIINELVISCTLSDVTASRAMSLVRPWVAGRSISF